MRQPDNAVMVSVCEAELPILAVTLQRPVAAGQLLRLRASGAYMLMGAAVLTVTPDGRPALPVRQRFTTAELGRDFNFWIGSLSLVVLETPEALAAGSVLQVRLRLVTDTELFYHLEKPPAGLPQRCFSGITWRLEVGTVPEARSLEFQPVAAGIDLRLTAGPPVRLEAALKPDGRVLVTHFDALTNPTGASGSISVTGEGNTLSVAASGTPAAVVVSPGRVGFGDGRVRVRDSAGRETVSNARPLGIDGTPAWFGEFHWHTDFSGDGLRSLADALASARDELALDFAGPGDHIGPDGAFWSHAGKRTTAEQAEICRRFDEPGRFCTLAGAELSGRYGHLNLYAEDFDLFREITAQFAEGLLPFWMANPNRYPLADLIRLCPPGRTLLIPHHTNMDSYMRERVVGPDGRPYWCAFPWPLPADRHVVRLVEMTQLRGSFETEEVDEDWRVFDGGLGGSVRRGLDRGYRVGFVGGTDNHCGWPTRGGAGYCGVTAVFAEALNPKSIFHALHQRRCYATSGARIVADATLNGQPLGSELVLAPGADRQFRLRIRGTAPLAQVQVVHGGRVLADLPVPKDSWDFDMEWADERPGRALEDVYYYVRARQCDGHCVWLSPFWVDLPPE